jgi:hypothetical protein
MEGFLWKKLSARLLLCRVSDELEVMSDEFWQ